jgi:hypothetical protein
VALRAGWGSASELMCRFLRVEETVIARFRLISNFTREINLSLLTVYLLSVFLFVH